MKNVPVVQQEEHSPPKRKVTGANPVGDAILNTDIILIDKNNVIVTNQTELFDHLVKPPLIEDMIRYAVQEKIPLSVSLRQHRKGRIQ